MYNCISDICSEIY